MLGLSRRSRPSLPQRNTSDCRSCTMEFSSVSVAPSGALGTQCDVVYFGERNLQDFKRWNVLAESIEAVEQKAVKEFFGMIFLSLRQSSTSGRFLESLPAMYNSADHDSPLYSATIAL